MKRRAKLRKKRNINFKLKMTRVNITIILVLTMVFTWFLLLNDEASLILYNYAELETKKLSTLIINKAVSTQANNTENLENLVTTTLNKNKEIISVDFNTSNINKSLNSLTNTVQTNLKLLEEGDLSLYEIPETNSNELPKDYKNKGIIYEIPFGAIVKNPIIADLGPKIPVKVKLVGSVVSNVKTKISNYGINNAMLEVYIEIEVSEQVILPFISKRVTISQEIPVAMKVIQGTVPKFYGGSMSEKSNQFSIPIE